MNVIFGLNAIADGQAIDTDLIKQISDQLGQAVEIRQSANAGGWFCFSGDKGAILGVAESSDLKLCVLGSLYHPLPDWTLDTAPPSDPDLSAAYLLERYREKGEKFLDYVTGQYAVLVIDEINGAILLGADPVGMRGWYLWESKDGYGFSTNLNLLTQITPQPLKVDRSQEDFLLIYGFYPHGGTTYQDVSSLSSGQVVRLAGKFKDSRKIIYENPWSEKLQFRGDDIESMQALTDRLYDAFMVALEEQTADNVRAAVLLGGFDSALVASALQRLGKDVETFSFAYAEHRYNQPYTNTLADFLGIQHHWVSITRDIFADGLKDFSLVFNQPTNWPNYVIQTAHLCRVIREAGFRFCYSGDGCDTVFLGYPGTYRRAVILERFPTLPAWLVRLLEAIFARDAPEYLLGHPYRVFLNLIRSLGRKMPARGFVSFRIMDEVSLRQLRLDDPPEQAHHIENMLSELAEPVRGLPTLRLAYVGKSLVSPNKNKLIGSADSSGVSILSPYLHPGLKHFASSLPESLCRPQEDTPSSVTGKYALMKMAEDKGLLPKEIIYQPKVAAVDGPIDEWYAGPLNSFVMELLSDLPFKGNMRYLKRLSQTKLAEEFFKDKVMVDRVVSHALSMLITYASFARLADTQAQTEF